MTEPLRIYTPDSSLASPRRMAAEMLGDLLAAREMAWRLAMRDIRAQYRQAFLGVLWAFIGPLATTVTWVFLSSAGIVSLKATTLPYPVYVFTGTLLWSILVDAMNTPLQHTNASRSLLAKLNFPREALLLSGLLQLLFNTGIKLMLMLIALIVVGINPGWQVLLFPVAVAGLMVVGFAIGLLVTPLGLLYTDVGRAIPLLMGFLMYLSPVVLPMPAEGWVATLYRLNPFTSLVATARDWLTGQPAEMVGPFAVVGMAGALLFFVAWGAWRLAMPIIIERASA